MHRYVFAGLAFLGVLLAPVLTASAQAQTFTLPEIGMERTGACQQIAVRERNGKTMVPLGCVSPKGWALRPDNFKAVGVGTLDDEFHATVNPDAVQISPGMGVAYCPGLACIPGVTDRNQRASMVVSGSTQLDGEAEEQLLALSMTTKTGKLTPWSASASYVTGQNILGSGDNVYRVVANCTSGTTMPVLPNQNDPKGAVVSNGSCQLKWINRGAIAAKLTAYFENEVEPGAGNAWTQANNFIMRPGAPTNFNINTEMDFSNISGTDCQLGQNCTALRLGMGGPNKATQALDITTDNTAGFKTIWGIRLNGANLASDALIGLDSNSKYGIAANQLGLGGDTFTGGLILDNSKSPASLIITNQKTQASIIDSSPGSGATLVTSNTRNSYDLGLGATAPIGIALNGTYGNAAIDTQNATIAAQAGSPTALVASPGQQVCFAGYNVCWRYDASAQRIKLRWNNADVFSIDANGNVRAASFNPGAP